MLHAGLALCEQQRQRAVGKRHRNADAKRPARLRPAQQQNLVIHRQDALRIAEHELALSSQAQARFCEELGPHQVLQALYLRADRGLREVERVACLGEAPELGDGGERAQQLDRNVDLVVAVMHERSPGRWITGVINTD